MRGPAMQVGKSYATPREALLLNAKFVSVQLGALDNKPTTGGVKFSELPFTASLIKEVHHFLEAHRLYVVNSILWALTDDIRCMVP
jgi:hypothetical protein